MPKQSLRQNFAGVITGASSGIGKALAVELAEKYKAKLILNARSQVALSETANLVRQSGGQCEIVVGDLADSQVAIEVVQKCLEKFGSIDLLVNNAGLSKTGSTFALTPEDWRKVFAVNFFAPLESIYQAVPYMIKNGSGKIVNISSVAGKIAIPGSVCYAASKFALTGMSEGIAAELASKNIDVITVCPGWVRSDFFEKNKFMEDHNPTKIAKENNWQGWLMRNVLSISNESCARSIITSLEAGGSHEIVLTIPGVVAVGINTFMPGLLGKLAAKVKT